MRWWHVFGGLVPAGLFAGTYQLTVVGPMDHAVPLDEELDGLPWLATMDHDPTQDERDALTPREFVW